MLQRNSVLGERKRLKRPIEKYWYYSSCCLSVGCEVYGMTHLISKYFQKLTTYDIDMYCLTLRNNCSIDGKFMANL